MLVSREPFQKENLSLSLSPESPTKPRGTLSRESLLLGIKQADQVKMFKNTFQSGFLSILYSLGSKPLQIWDKEVVNGHVKRLQDEDIQSNVLEIVGSNIQSTYITCPADPSATLGIKLPFLVVIVKNLKKYFTFEIQVLDDKNVRRRFRASNFQVCCHSSETIYLHHATEDGRGLESNSVESG
ncbi:cilia- and flagella-associated protein 20 isoform X3 [Juglans microcarpa x Juglans regia]|uniref:cilia- and flagella-associated protein 20 isoform X3 n=1 Tax=Juglans microcarpa x Juglans regia TaxID=2249226 RepID=UPI001B7E85E2|nr:cilia- and flagella-associated protein 20 isoform X3 [Juglans microcarpa x Juglans regia]